MQKKLNFPPTLPRLLPSEGFQPILLRQISQNLMPESQAEGETIGIHNYSFQPRGSRHVIITNQTHTYVISMQPKISSMMVSSMQLITLLHLLSESFWVRKSQIFPRTEKLRIFKDFSAWTLFKVSLCTYKPFYSEFWPKMDPTFGFWLNVGVSQDPSAF